ncbi:aspartate kinase [Candidatus Bathyarchaeota archaeon]|nr:aspartate kinase [Candidatus Bathyarchaeota archaeon]
MVEKIVSKFGGSLLYDKNSFLEAAKYIVDLTQKYKVISVVSAPKGVTDVLTKLYKNKKDKVILNLKNRYKKIIQGIRNLSIKETAFKLLNEELEKLKTPINYDQFISTGENHSGIILSHFLKYLGCNSIYMDGYKAGIIVDSRGVIKEELSIKNIKENLLHNLSKGYAPIVGGFVGKQLETGEYKLLGRNSTDVTGAIVAAAMKAKYEIIKDVPGIYIVEPEYGKTNIISRLSYDEAGELTWRGIEVIHPIAIKIAKAYNIPIQVKTIKSKTSTLVCNETATTYKKPIAGISARKFYLLTIYDEFMNTPEGRGYLSNVTSILSNYGIDIYDVATSANEISLTINLNHRFIMKEKIELIIERDLKRYGYKPKVKGGSVGALSVTGEVLKNNVSTISRLINVLNKSKINLFMISKSLNSSNIILIIDENKLKNAVNIIYREFFV